MPHYCLDMAALPDELYTPDTPTEHWMDRVEKAAEAFPPGALGALSPLHPKAELERLVGVPLYLMFNWLPFLLPIVSWAAGGWRGLLILAVVLALLSLKQTTAFLYKVLSQLPRLAGVPEAQLFGQYAYTERNTQKYLSMRLVWSDGFEAQRRSSSSQPVIFAIVPHGIAPLGITAYPAFSRLGGGALCRWTAAPVVLKLPLVGAALRSIGYVAAKGKAIGGALAAGSSVGIVLDGIAGMFQPSGEALERAVVQRRKAIAAIALKSGCPIVPVYGFGHTALWSVVTDPFGLLEALSVALDVSVCPFYGRWGWPLGAPRRRAVLVALGTPVHVGAANPSPAKEEVDALHAKLVDGFRQTFDAHKAEYGWASRELQIV